MSKWHKSNVVQLTIPITMWVVVDQCRDPVDAYYEKQDELLQMYYEMDEVDANGGYVVNQTRVIVHFMLFIITTQDVVTFVVTRYLVCLPNLHSILKPYEFILSLYRLKEHTSKDWDPYC